MLTEADLKVGRVYSAKNLRCIGDLWNDRMIKWIGLGTLQYDGPAVAHGRHYPRVTFDQFLKWAAEDVTDKCPEGEWRQV